MFRRVCLGIVALTVVAWLAVPASAEVIYFDGFSRPQSGLQHLSGTAPEVRSGTLGGSSTATWLAYAGPDYAGAPVEWDHSWQTDGTQAKMAWEGDPVQRMAWLPFVPQSGQVYTYSMRMNNTWAGSNNWIGMGFFKDVSDTQTPYFTYAAGPQIFERPMGATASEYSWSAAGPTGNGNSDNMAWGVKGQHEFEDHLGHHGGSMEHQLCRGRRRHLFPQLYLHGWRRKPGYHPHWDGQWRRQDACGQLHTDRRAGAVYASAAGRRLARPVGLRLAEAQVVQ